jgi:hypothetical protein
MQNDMLLVHELPQEGGEQQQQQQQQQQQPLATVSNTIAVTQRVQQTGQT